MKYGFITLSSPVDTCLAWSVTQHAGGLLDLCQVAAPLSLADAASQLGIRPVELEQANREGRVATVRGRSGELLVTHEEVERLRREGGRRVELAIGGHRGERSNQDGPNGGDPGSE
jgi:hypothetical protein